MNESVRPEWSFTLDWYVRVVEFDPTAPKVEPGEPPPERRRYAAYSRRIRADSRNAAERMRQWHIDHDTWLPSNAVRDVPALTANVSEIQRVERRVK
jgi:hypothetical protein